MDLKGAELRSFYGVTTPIPKNTESYIISKINIPLYQRPYTWNSEKVNRLIQDFKENVSIGDNISNDYFAGSILTTVESDGNQHNVIDGQQRYTTLFLTNFVNFLILRVYIRECFVSGSPFNITNITHHVEHIYKSIDYLFENSCELKKELSNLVEELKKAIENDILDSNKIEDLTSKYKSLIELPECSEDHADFNKMHVNGLNSLINNYGLKLSYSRSYYCNSLRSALCSCIIKLSSQSKCNLVIHSCVDCENESIDVYLKNIYEIFKSFNENRKPVNIKPNAISDAYQLSDEFIKFLEGLKVCLVQTGNPRDAYTLFEVLNDRAVALDELDLIKNNFYKALSLSQNDDDLVNQTLDILDKIWVEEVFTDKTPQSEKNLIAVLFASYLTGNPSIKTKNLTDSKAALETYLEKFTSSYTKEKIIEHFNVLRAIKLLLNIFEFSYKSKEISALKVEYNFNSTDCSKAISFLHAQDQIGVLAGIVNVILYNYARLSTNGFTYKEADFRQYITELKTKNTLHDKVQLICKRLWRWSITCKDATTPKDKANILIKDFNIDNRKDFSDFVFPDITDEEKMEFKEYLNDFRYKSNKFKLRILFSRLLQCERNTSDKLAFPLARLQFTDDQICSMQIDHLEPAKIGKDNPLAYFLCNNPNERDVIVNGLGNMFPLLGVLNNSKSNVPLCLAWKYIETDSNGNPTGINDNILLYREVKELFKNYKTCNGNACTTADLLDISKGVPTAEFFSKRRDLLIEEFLQVIDL